MFLIREALLAVTGFPIQPRTLDLIATRRGLNLDGEANQVTLESSSFKLATADVIYTVILSPNVSQGGQSFSFGSEQWRTLRHQADAIYGEYGNDEDKSKIGVKYGYKGSRL